MNKIDITNKTEMVNALTTAFCTVEFTKANGDHRIMECTLQPNELPEVQSQNTKKSTKLADHLLRVYDCEAKGWRTINTNTLITFIEN